ncbi:cell adhesion molecule CEACAM1-like [Rhinoderma darwinii]|uniref:cell adhesion molecule CEACAM1-like n=1 Tax=Rhinoderma darwinii TaxID=43563 RepID=UPI003F67C661
MERAPRRPVILPIIILLVVSGILAPVISMETVNGVLGHSVYFVVPVPLSSQYRIDWNFGHTGQVTVIAKLKSGSLPQYNPLYNGRCELLENGTLKLNDISYADERTYKLKLFNPETFTSYVQRYELNVYPLLSPPVLNSNVTNSRLVSGTHVALQCDAGGQIVTTYAFYRDQKTICSEPHVTCRGSFLDFKPLSENDSGIYTCSIQNPVSTNTSNSLNRTVYVPVSIVTVTSNTSGLLWPGRDSVSLRCLARGTNVSYSWSLEGVPLPQNPQYYLSQNNSTLIINPVSKNDNGPFTCTASNWVNKENSNKVTFNLASPVSLVSLSNNKPKVVWAGKDSVTLRCSAQGSAITFSWSLNGKPVPPNPPYYITQRDFPPISTLTIRPVSRNDTLPFTCTASNYLSSESSNELHLSLNWHPEGYTACTVEPHDSMYQLHCSWPGGQPAANVTMIFNNIAETGQNEVAKNVSVSEITKKLNLTCNGAHLKKKFSCTIIYGLPRDKNNGITAEMDGETANLKTGALP